MKGKAKHLKPQEVKHINNFYNTYAKIVYRVCRELHSFNETIESFKIQFVSRFKVMKIIWIYKVILYSFTMKYLLHLWSNRTCNVCIMFFILLTSVSNYYRTVHLGPFRCCGSTWLWTHWHLWLWLLNFPVKNYWNVNLTAERRLLSLEPWWKIFLVIPYISLLLYFVYYSWVRI